MKLIIVESPAKARTITRFLDDEYTVTSSYGHIRDLPGSAKEIPAKYKKEPWRRYGVNLDDGYKPIYVISADSKKQVAELKKLLKKADEVLLATDEDREGEAISWHLLEVLDPKVPVRRISFHEITKSAINSALESPREIDMKLVRAQEGRRILDRLYGYSLSPVLWKKVRTKLSAGRVQSVAVRLVVEKEEERQAFHVAKYCDIEAAMTSADLAFVTRLTEIDGIKIAGGKDFDPDTGELKSPTKRIHLSDELARELADTAGKTRPWRVARVTRKETTQRPSPPFTTSTLQQAASGRLKMSPQRVMRIAQRLYEGVGSIRDGLITYMRTDSLTLSEKSLAEIESHVQKNFGPDYTKGPRRYKTKAKGAQEAHEAIRPTHVDRTPESVADRLDSEELAVYRLIWNRTVSSQMTDAKLDKTAVDIAVTAGDRELTFRSNGSVVRFPGFFKVYGDKGKDTILPEMSEGRTIGDEGQDNVPPVEITKVESLGHETQPPARFTEASLIKKLEEEGIGRPSTYASVIGTIQSREYVVKKSGALLPSYIGMAVTHLLREHFNKYVDLQFTALMEEELDQIATGEIDWVNFLECFFRGCKGETGLEQDIEAELEKIEFPRILVGNDPKTGYPIVLRIGRNYVSVQVEGLDDRRATLPVDLLIDELTPEKALDLIVQRDKSREPIGVHPDTGQNIYTLTGPFGPYLQLGEQEGDKKPKRISLGKKTDPSSIDLTYALRLLSLPREIGTDPETGKPVRAGLGRFGPYVEKDRVFASVQTVDTLFTITLDEALDRIKNKNKRTVLRDLGKHPETGEPLAICKGRYGPYVTDGKLNGNIGRDRDPEDVTVEEAVSLLKDAAKRKKTGKKKTAKKKTVKKK
ncbi:MAG: type I DNA topoisomerase, partial [Candidatus Krumholzibacteria bacterium]|nr:type I DNA topoisomerase [Candidatus Krumholzibacteria bacterium]